MSILRWYTNLPAAIHLLSTKKLALLNYKEWDDKNDIACLDAYKKLYGFGSVLVRCFSGQKETYHHWKIYAPSGNGVCIKFKRKPLVTVFRSMPDVRYGQVTYLNLEQLKRGGLNPKRLPFYKRLAFDAEQEFRVIKEIDPVDVVVDYIPLDLEWIESVTLSPWLHESQIEPVKTVLRNIDGCGNVSVYRTSLISNTQWRAAAESIANGDAFKESGALFE